MYESGLTSLWCVMGGRVYTADTGMSVAQVGHDLLKTSKVDQFEDLSQKTG